MRRASPPSSFSLGALALVGAMAGLLGCGPGFSVRNLSSTPAPIGTTGPRSYLPPGGGSTTGRPYLGPGASMDDADHDHDDQSEPNDPAPDSGELPGAASPTPASHAGMPVASKYASLDRASCEAELGKRRIGFDRVGEARGVIAPLRLKGAIAGVDFHSMLPTAQRRTSPYEIYDCRLVLALDDWARVLARHDVVEVVHYSVYRPPPAKAVLNGPGRRHSGALAIDAAIFKLRDGTTISVEKDFHGRIGSKPCGAGAASSAGLPPPRSS